MGKEQKKSVKPIDINGMLRIIGKVSRGERLTEQENIHLLNTSLQTDSEEYNKLKAEFEKQKKDGKVMPDTDFGKMLELGFQQAMSTPEGRAMYQQKAQETEKTNIAEGITSALNTAISVGEIVGATQQISQSRRLARQSRRPQRPTPLTADPLLSQAITEAQQGKFDAARRLAPAQLAILDQYLSDINQARTASTGQAGTYGALAQVASTRRGRGAQQLAPIMDDMIARQDERRDNLLRLKLGQNQAIQESQAMGYGTDMQAYLQEQEAIGQLGAQGRENLRAGIVGLGQQIVDPIAQAATKRRFDRLRATMGQHPEAFEIRKQAEIDLNNTYNGVPPMLEQAYPSTYDSGYFSGRY